MLIPKSIITAGSFVIVAQMRFHDAQIIFRQVSETRKAITVIKGLFDLATTMTASFFLEKRDADRLPQPIVEPNRFISQPGEIRDRFRYFMFQGA
jgi:hypothetical protein